MATSSRRHRRTRSEARWPSGVSSQPPAARTSTFPPGARSSAAKRRDTVTWLRPSVSAARVNRPPLATSSRTRRSSGLGRAGICTFSQIRGALLPIARPRMATETRFRDSIAWLVEHRRPSRSILVPSLRRDLMTGTFQHTWDNAVEQHADSVFLVFRSESGTRSEWIYGEFDALVARVAGRLREAGVRPGSSVHAVLPNCPASSRCGSPRRSSERGWCPPTRHPRHATSPTTSAGRSPVGVCAADRAAVYHDGANVPSRSSWSTCTRARLWATPWPITCAPA